MKVGLIGNGGREHAIAKGLCLQDDVELFVAASSHNPGIRELAADYRSTGLDDLRGIQDYFIEKRVDLVVVGPEAPLIAGIVDVIRNANLPILGPTQSQARLEGDKSFMRRLIKDKVGWGSPIWQKVTTRAEAEQFLEQVGAVVVKPLGMTGGKGVRVAGTQLEDAGETLAYIQSLLETDGAVLLEEQVLGEEFSRMAFVSDGVLLPVPCMQDFKYALDGDQGLMTGGMGAYSTAEGGLPFLNARDYEQADQLLAETIQALESTTGTPYRGFLYGQFMASKDGIMLIEYNVRLGDPEALNLMALLDTAPSDLFFAIATGSLSPNMASFKEQASVSKYLVPQAYPEPIDEPIKFEFDADLVEDFGCSLIYSSVERTGTKGWLALGSRTLGIAGLGETPGVVSNRIEHCLEALAIPQLRHRKDIGNPSIIDQKVEKMDEIRQNL